MAAKPDYYKTLGVSKTASSDEIKKAFRRLARKHHPDAGGDEQAFKEINEAYEVLSDEKKRRLYDRFGSTPNRPSTGKHGTQSVNVDFSDFFGQGSSFGSWAEILENIRRGEGVFGSDWDFSTYGRQVQPQEVWPNQERRGQDVTMNLNLSFDEALNGTKKQVSIRIPGKTDSDKLIITIPPGAVDGGKLRLKGKGAEGENGGTPGDLLVTTIVEKHPYFKREGADILLDVPISYSEAVLGGSVILPTPDGKKLRLKITPGTQHGTSFTIPGKGAPKVKGIHGECGDLILNLHIVVPETITDRERLILIELGEIENESVRSW